MRAFNQCCLLFILFLPIFCNGLMVPKQLHLSPMQRATGSHPAASASIPEEPFEHQGEDKILLQKVRQELVQKYLDQGDSLSKAEQEVDYFLQDKARSREYMEMRKYNLSQLDDGLGIDLFVGLQFIASFFIGFAIRAFQDGDLSVDVSSMF